MLINALDSLYHQLVQAGKLPADGWAPAYAAYGLSIDDNGDIASVIDLRTENKKGQQFMLPIPPAGRTSGIKAALLCDNIGYVLGCKQDKSGKLNLARGTQMFEAFKNANLSMLEQASGPDVDAICKFLNKHDPQTVMNNPVLTPYLDEMIQKGNLLFLYQNRYLHENPSVHAAADKILNQPDPADIIETVCIDTGMPGQAARTHDKIKNLPDGQPSGCALMSANMECTNGYGHKQGGSYPVSYLTAQHYVKAINYMLDYKEGKKRPYQMTLGNTTVLFWSDTGDTDYNDLARAQMGDTGFLSFTPDTDNENENETAETSKIADNNESLQKKIESVLDQLRRGQAAQLNEKSISPDSQFYILGLSANSSRVIVRFFLNQSFGQFLNNVQKHQERLQIFTGAEYSRPMSVYSMLKATVNSKATGDRSKPLPGLAADVLMAILNNRPYPQTLLNQVNLRVRAEVQNKTRISQAQASITKAYYTAYPGTKESVKEVLTVALNPENRNVGYLLGRLFYTLERLQAVAIEADTGIGAKYFNSAMTTPKMIFPTLTRLSQKHLAKLQKTSKGAAIGFDKAMTEIMDKLPDQLPTHLDMQDQSAFLLGYYHQKAANIAAGLAKKAAKAETAGDDMPDEE